ncbi:hypothetical protein C0Q70_06767 [Pomacea canaliculata]|uniref:Uncharacterized protein n=1 Tax=Pomacea canaliculata TaxID=400727 RepID=A0A2T7PD50_POMCA|nr:hypothetical protein C0Q70_06767 [Pomacea canaliculata]
MNASGTWGLDYSNKGAKLGVSERAGRQEGGSRLLGGGGGGAMKRAMLIRSLTVHDDVTSAHSMTSSSSAAHERHHVFDVKGEAHRQRARMACRQEAHNVVTAPVGPR